MLFGNFKRQGKSRDGKDWELEIGAGKNAPEVPDGFLRDVKSTMDDIINMFKRNSIRPDVALSAMTTVIPKLIIIMLAELPDNLKEKSLDSLCIAMKANLKKEIKDDKKSEGCGYAGNN